MALTVGVNCGFVTARPTADPAAGSANLVDTHGNCGKFVAPSGTNTLTEIGAWINNATQAANMQVGIYSHDSGNDRPGTLLASSGDFAKGTDAGWKYAAVSYSLVSGTTYWIGVQIDDTTTATELGYDTSTGQRDSIVDGITSLPTTWADYGPYQFDNELTAIYAVYSSSGGGGSTTLTAFRYFGRKIRRPISGAVVGRIGEVSLTGLGVDDYIAQEVFGYTSGDSLTANSISSESTVGNPALNQVHNLTASGVASASSVGAPAVTQSHVITASGISSASEVGNPLLTQNGVVYDLTAVGVSSASSVGNPAIQQVHALIASGIASATSVGSPALTVIYNLIADGVASECTVGSPEISQAHALIADNIASATTVGNPDLTSGGATAYGLICVGDTWYTATDCNILIDVNWKTVTEILVVSGESWHTVTS